MQRDLDHGAGKRRTRRDRNGSRGRLYESGGHGRLSQIAARANGDPNIYIYSKSLVYGATALANGTQNSGYLADIAAAKARLTTEIEYLVSICPYVNIILAGYSQGAQIIGDTISSYSSRLSASASQHITGVVLFADPSYRSGERWDDGASGSNLGTFPREQGAFVYFNRTNWDLGFPVDVPSVHSWCIPGDAICQQNYSDAGMNIHGSGYTTDYMNRGWDFLRVGLVDNG